MGRLKKVLFYALKDRSTPLGDYCTACLGETEFNNANMENIRRMLDIKLKALCKDRFENAIGAFMFIEESQEGKQFQRFNNGLYVPASFRYLTLACTWKDNEIHDYVY